MRRGVCMAAAAAACGELRQRGKQRWLPLPLLEREAAAAVRWGGAARLRRCGAATAAVAARGGGKRGRWQRLQQCGAR